MEVHQALSLRCSKLLTCFKEFWREALSGLDCQDAALRVKGLDLADNFSRNIAATDHKAAVSVLMDWIEQRCRNENCLRLAIAWCMAVRTIGNLSESPQKLLKIFTSLSLLILNICPRRSMLVKHFIVGFPIASRACFDTAFHHDLHVWLKCCRFPEAMKRKV